MAVERTASPARPAAVYRLRAARPEDARFLWEWANDGEVRRQAFHAEPIPWESHTAWYAAKLSHADCLIAVLESSDGTPVGQIRFDRTPEGIEVDVSVASLLRGRGIGAELLRQGLEQGRSRWPAGTSVVARVLDDNARSRRLFERLGFVWKGMKTRDGKPYHHLERPL